MGAVDYAEREICIITELAKILAYGLAKCITPWSAPASTLTTPFFTSAHTLIAPTKHKTFTRLGLGLESVGEAAHVVLERALVPQELHVSTVDPDAAGLALLNVLLATEGGEAPVLADDDLLATGELVLAAAEGLDGGGTV